MALNNFTQQTQTLDAHSTLGDRPNINDGLTATQLKTRYDRDVNRNKDYINGTLISELEAETASDSGASKIGVETVSGVTGNDIQTIISSLKSLIDLRQLLSNIVTAFQVTPDDTHYPSEKLVKDSLDALDTAKAEKSNVLELDNTTSFTPDADYEPSTKKYVDDEIAGVILGQIPDNSLTDVKLSNAIDQIKREFARIKALSEMEVF